MWRCPARWRSYPDWQWQGSTPPPSARTPPSPPAPPIPPSWSGASLLLLQVRNSNRSMIAGILYLMIKWSCVGFLICRSRKTKSKPLHYRVLQQWPDRSQASHWRSLLDLLMDRSSFWSAENQDHKDEEHFRAVPQSGDIFKVTIIFRKVTKS